MNVYLGPISFPQATPCDTFYLEVKYKADLGNTGPRFCETVRNFTITSQTEEMLILFKGNASNHGFILTFQSGKLKRGPKIFNSFFA